MKEVFILKSINLHSLLDAHNNLNSSEFDQYKNYYGIKPKESELDDLSMLIPLLEENDVCDFNHFYFGFQIERISSEFDLIRLGTKKTINIELKREADIEVIKKQMKRSRYYLGVLEGELLTYTYITRENKLYKYDDEDFLSEVTAIELAAELNSQEILTNRNINDLFDPTVYLVSPFNSTSKFIEGKYFLTNPQEKLKRDIEKLINSKSDQLFIGIKGEPGTGKTLLTYDIAKDLRSEGKKVLLIFCGNLNLGHFRLRNKSWDIKPIKDYEYFIDTLDKYDYIIIDESQRIYLNQFNGIVDKVRASDIKCVFSYDPAQCFSDIEFKRKIPDKIKNDCGAKIFELSTKIRANKEISSFVSNLFNVRNGNPNLKYDCINVLYFSSIANVKETISLYSSDDWEVINFTSSRFNNVSYDAYQFEHNEIIHNVIGQEFDKVLGVIDLNFYYDSFGSLSSRGVKGSPGYELDKMLYQILTRARKEITLVIYRNKDILNHCLKILNSSKN